ncbi:hypothetical protein HMPREF0971_00318 [Segatella oris F0302]|uniref:Uncharacterized protein n=1 Tax=Segatella oris F0302 TaxID=649760 RepID=D1QMN4_9BACT|nr:hypothetical protein HMPREF0971_00318 [Segatella oris F0302]
MHKWTTNIYSFCMLVVCKACGLPSFRRGQGEAFPLGWDWVVAYDLAYENRH